MVILMNKEIEEQLRSLPDKPGVYLMKDRLGKVIYVGKALSLRKRIRSYFRQGNHTYKTRIMIGQIRDFDYIITDTEVEAYILEANLIKKHHPEYNIRLKDDKTYPYIKVTLNEDFPRVFKTRLVKNDGARYYGPFVDVHALYRTIEVLQDLFGLRTCKKDLKTGQYEDRPCLNYHIGKCSAPCIGNIDQASYRKMVDQVCLFLSGHQDELIARVKARMQQAARERNFEKAARLRDSMKALNKILEQQKVMNEKKIDQDVIGLARDEEDNVCIQILFIRNGRLIGQEYYLMEGIEEEDNNGIMGSYLQQYYEDAPQYPDEILLDTEVEQIELLADLLKIKKGRRVKIYLPERGGKRRLVEMAEQNAVENLKKEMIKRKYRDTRTSEAIIKLADYLGLEHNPDYIEGFDISNIQGRDPVASMVVFKGGEPVKQDYRRYRIKSVEGPDDFAMMREVVERRYSRLLREERRLPDLILVDGGKGQLGAAHEILCQLGLSHQAIIGLAKREEEVFLPGQSEPIIIPDNSAALHLLQRVRDEAHRFAINYHRNLRSRRLTHTMLEDIPGVGQGRRRALLQHFGSLGEIKKASISQLEEVPGISSHTARVIYDYLREHTRAF